MGKDYDFKKSSSFSFKIKDLNRMYKRQTPHGDFDHMGEASYLVENFKVDKVISNVGDYNELEKN